MYIKPVLVTAIRFAASSLTDYGKTHHYRAERGQMECCCCCPSCQAVRHGMAFTSFAMLRACQAVQAFHSRQTPIIVDSLISDPPVSETQGVADCTQQVEQVSEPLSSFSNCRKNSACGGLERVFK